MSTAFHPQTDGTTERFNQEIELYLSIYCLSNPKSWVEALPILEFTHNSRVHSDRQQTPFELIMGYQPPSIPTAFNYSSFPTAKHRLDNLEMWRQEALAAHEIARQRMASRIHSTYHPFKQHQKVWLESKNIKLGYNKKISTKREGPFPVTKVLGPVNFRLKLPEGWKMHPDFHASLLTPYTENEVHGPNDLRPPPEMIEDEPEYEAEIILKHRRIKDQGIQYQVKWKGYPVSEATWEPEANLTHAKELIQDYQERRNLTSSTSNSTPIPESINKKTNRRKRNR